ncbi:MAG: YihA family ribosome biogenesis GTP-binding protein [Cyclobacteriaceae bacterium]|nr:YihA family ribosome biogenesis GTP-binding protein [Cyclobacteriaceae bacterium]
MVAKAEFIKSSVNVDQCPSHDKPEYAFIGRSNVGKSSLINMITARKNLAKTSSKPGKTQLINHFCIDDAWYLVDLPGYGWSKVSKKTRATWGPMIEKYLLERKNLACLFVLLDTRLEPQSIDYDFIEWLGEKQIPFALIFTKADKQSANQNAKILAVHKRQLKLVWEYLPEIFISSSVDHRGRSEVLEYISSINQDWSNDKY